MSLLCENRLFKITTSDFEEVNLNSVLTHTSYSKIRILSMRVAYAEF